MQKQKFTLQEKNKFDEIFKNKKDKTEIEEKFYKKTEKYIRFIKWIPGLRMVGVGNSISMNSASKDSDIDLFIVTDKNRMWFVRILVTLIFQILGVRKNDKKHAGRFCLSFFCELEALDFSFFALEKDPYLYFWILYFKPILDYGNTYNLFIEKNKSWADFYKFENMLKENKKFIKYRNMSTEGFSPLKDILNVLNKIFKNIFLNKTKKHYKKIGKPYGIIISDKMLKFHDDDIRKEISKLF